MKYIQSLELVFDTPGCTVSVPVVGDIVEVKSVAKVNSISKSPNQRRHGNTSSERFDGPLLLSGNEDLPALQASRVADLLLFCRPSPAQDRAGLGTPGAGEEHLPAAMMAAAIGTR